jgi:hypothetical protein
MAPRMKQTARKSRGGQSIRGRKQPTGTSKQPRREKTPEDEDMEVESMPGTPPRTPSPPPSQMDAASYIRVRKPRQVYQPVMSVVHPLLQGAWKINRRHKMGLIFDVVNPARQFKRGSDYNDDDDLPYAKHVPNSRDDPNVTESDPNATRQPYLSRIYK